VDRINYAICENWEKTNKEISELLMPEGFHFSQDSIRARRNRLKAKYGENLEEFNPSIIESECFKLGIDPASVNSAWIKTKNVSMQISQPAQDFEFFEEFIERIKKYAPKYPKIKRTKSSDPRLLVHAPSDIHIGKYSRFSETGKEYNSEIAVNRVLDATDGILTELSGYTFDKVILVGGNDALHIDNPRNTTTSGTFQDTVGMWWEMVDEAVEMYRKVIETLMTVAEVEVVWVPSNHDFTLGICVGKILEAMFKNSYVTFDCTMNHRKYRKYGKNLIGFSHGDGAKLHDLPLLMANEAKDWSETDYRYMYLGHVHHKDQTKWKSGKDYIGVCVEHLRSPSESDRWHHTNGYTNLPAIEAFVHHPERGQTTRVTYYCE
jgi:hypothetical protein